MTADCEGGTECRADGVHFGFSRLISSHLLFFSFLTSGQSLLKTAGLFPALTPEFCLTLAALAAISRSQAGKGEAYTWTLRCLAPFKRIDLKR